MATNKPHLNLVFIGHVDHGKSTTVGRILYNTGVVSDQQLKKLKDLAKDVGKDTFEFAFVMDRLKEERERGLTIDLMHEKFESNKYYFTIIDAPGHRDFVKNMITGASQADAAVLVVDANDGVMAQTKEHIYLSKTLGINQMIVFINKMDRVNYSEDRYNEVKNLVTEHLKKVAFDMNKIQFIPGSALDDENVTKKAEKMSWYKGSCLLEAMDNFEIPEKLVNLPLRIPVQDVFSITGIGTVPVGRVETGVLKVNDKVVFEPAGVSGEVKSIEMHHEPLEKAEPGDNVGFNVRGVGKKDLRRGDVAGHPDKPPTVVKEFTAKIVVLDHPSVMTRGYTPVFHAHTAQVACKIVDILEKSNAKEGTVKNPDFIKTGDAATIKVVPTQPMVIEKASEIPPMGRFAIRDMGKTVAAGMVIDLVPRN